MGRAPSASLVFVASALFSLPFYLIGAWPIIGFLGLDVAAVVVALSRQFSVPRAPTRTTA